MNYLYNADINPTLTYQSDIPMEKFFIKHKRELPEKKSKRIEYLIEKYSFKIGKYQQGLIEESDEEYLLLRNDFEELIQDIRQINGSKKYQGLFSYLIDRAFFITPQIRSNKKNTSSRMNNNRSLLLKTLYTLSPEQFLACFN